VTQIGASIMASTTEEGREAEGKLRSEKYCDKVAFLHF
jgi:hypothetical protein